MLRAAAAAVWRSSPRLSYAAPAVRQVRYASSASDALDFGELPEQDSDEYVSTADPEHMQTLLKRLHKLKFPKIDRTKLQDAEFIAIADAAAEAIREIDNIRNDLPRYFQASDFEGSDVLAPHNYRLPVGITSSEDVRQELDERENNMEEDEDVNSDADDEDEFAPPPNSKVAKRMRAQFKVDLARELDRDKELLDENGDILEDETDTGENVLRFDIGGKENDAGAEANRSATRGEEEEEDEQMQARGGEEEELNYLSEEAEEAKVDEYDEKLSDFEERALEAMGDAKFLNFEKPRKTGMESLHDWFNEFKFVQRGGRFSLADQTKLHAKYVRDYTAKAATELDDFSQAHEFRSGFVINEVIKVGRHCKVTKGGRIFSYSTLVLVGTGKGTAGFGYGKGPTAAEATDRAYVDAERNLVSVPLYRGGLSGGFSFRKRGSFMKCWTHYPGINRNVNEPGNASHPVMHNILLAFGFNNAQLRSWKRRNWHNMLEGFFATLPKAVSHPEDTARKLGLRLKVLAHEERFDKLKPHYT